MKNVHSDRFSGISLAELQRMADHLVSTHPLTYEDDVVLPQQLSSLIPVPDSLPCPLCQCPECNTWFVAGSTSAINKHIDHNHGRSKWQPTYKQRYGQKFLLYALPMITNHTIVLPQNWNGIFYLPPTPSFSTSS